MDELIGASRAWTSAQMMDCVHKTSPRQGTVRGDSPCSTPAQRRLGGLQAVRSRFLPLPSAPTTAGPGV